MCHTDQTALEKSVPLMLIIQASRWMGVMLVTLQVLVGVYFFIAIMGCLLGIKRFEGALLLLPLAAGVLIFHVLVRWRIHTECSYLTDAYY
jgi:hypothetical protein